MTRVRGIAVAERIGDREGASGDTLGNFIETFAIGVHRR